MKVTKQINWIWQEMHDSPNKADHTKPMFGKWQYIYSNNYGSVAIQECLNIAKHSQPLWELRDMKIDDNIMASLQYFNTKKNAERKAYDMLGEKIDD